MKHEIKALNNHPHDNCKTKKERKEDQQLQRSLNKEPTKSSFAQFGEGRCFVCGNKKHISPNCPHKQSKPKNEWWINQQVQNFTHQNGDNNNDSIATTNTNSSGSNGNDQQNEGNNNTDNQTGMNPNHWSNCMNHQNFSQINLNQHNDLSQQDS